MHSTRLLNLFLLPLLATVAQPIVNINYGSVRGFVEGTVEKFYGIPYTEGPVQRFTEGLLPYTPKGVIDATALGPCCWQLTMQNKTQQDETRCLNLNIARPAGTTETDRLPVMVWIYGGGFNDGAVGIYNPLLLVPYGASLGLPFVFVAMNYRLNAAGFLNSKDLAARNVLNLGLKDQRLALRWVQRHIASFGGDPQKVTLFGESAGAISIGFHLIAYGNKKDQGLFRAAILESGAGTSLAVPSFEHFQNVYDFMVKQTDCQSARDTFKCLQFADPNVFYAAAKRANAFWGKRETQPFSISIDKDFVPEAPSKLLKSGAFARVPILTGENKDEGTFFVNKSENGYPNDQAVAADLVALAPNLTQEQLTKWLSLYPNNQTLGSPYDTGDRIYFSPQFKRAASIVGDLLFVSARRYLVETTSGFGLPTYAYRFDYVTNSSQINSPRYLGVAHAAEVPFVFRAVPSATSANMAAYWIAFATNLDPNKGVTGQTKWEQFDTKNRKQIRFETELTKMAVDDYRRDASDLINSILPKLLR